MGAPKQVDALPVDNRVQAHRARVHVRLRRKNVGGNPLDHIHHSQQIHVELQHGTEKVERARNTQASVRWLHIWLHICACTVIKAGGRWSIVFPPPVHCS